MSRSYRGVRLKAIRVYSVEEVMDAYSICRNTLSNWIAAGLLPVDGNRPQLFRGAELAWFHTDRIVSDSRPLRHGAFKCFDCRIQVFPHPQSVRFEQRGHGGAFGTAVCPGCGGGVWKFLNATECDKLRNALESNTSLECPDEGEESAPARIGKTPGRPRPQWIPENERVIRAYQIFAGRFAEATIDAHLASIRDFEAFFPRKILSSVTVEDAARYRRHLIEIGQTKRSRSTIRHRSLHLKKFFKWFVSQPGYRRMNSTICEHFQLRKSDVAKAIQPQARDYPTFEEVRQILSAMPAKTMRKRRDRAIVAATLLFGSRSASTASLRVGSVDLIARKVIQDATIGWVKNSKSQTTHWFPIREPAETILVEWVKELRTLGCGEDDALFPPDQALGKLRRRPRAERRAIEPWRTQSGIVRAFALGCRSAGLPYFNPHSAKHFLQSIRDEYCSTAGERSAWSFNLGHEHEQTTERNYATMTDEKRDEIFQNLTLKPKVIIDDIMLQLKYFYHELIRGTPEFKRAEELAEAHRASLKAESRKGLLDPVPKAKDTN